MIGLNSINTRLQNWQETSQKNITFNGCDFSQWALMSHEFIQDSLKNKNILVVCGNEDDVDDVHTALSSFFKTDIFSGLDSSPYSSTLGSESSLFHNFKIINNFFKKENFITVCSVKSFSQKIPDFEFFKQNKLIIEESDILSPDDMAVELVRLGYQHTPTVEEPGTFSKKGEIFDIYPIASKPIRIHYFDDMIEEIFFINQETQKTDKSKQLKNVIINCTPLFLAKKEYIYNLRDNLPRFQLNEREKLDYKNEVLRKLNEQQLFDNYATFLPLFFKETTSLSEVSKSDDFLTIIYNENNISNIIDEYFMQLQQEFEFETKLKDGCIFPKPAFFYDLEIEKAIENLKAIRVNHLDITFDIDQDIKSNISLSLDDSNVYFKNIYKKINLNTDLPKDKFEYIKTILGLIKTEFKESGDIKILVNNDHSKEEFKNLLTQNNFNSTHFGRINFVQANIKSGFYYKSGKTLYLSESDLFSYKKQKIKKQTSKNLDLFAEQLSTLQINDYIVHKNHGIGIYKGLESIEIGQSKSDFLVIHYQSQDKVYVPVYKMDLIQKHADSTSKQTLASLKSKKFENLKNKARGSVKTLAFDLLKLQAKRREATGFAFSPADEYFIDFEKSFKFQETPDQITTINSVIEDMCKETPMDRLICGDVGFGKTEIAMRAAFKAVLDKKQVAILVPTTVLALQHFQSFTERFKNFPVEIDFLSRFKTAKESKVTIENLKTGKIDIVIGTHKILSQSVGFDDLGLVIIDEEHRFGVAHKEKFKLMKNNIDFLTMTATPIPRTLQLSFLGIRDLSLIKTSPPKRKSIKSYIIKEDDNTIRQAIQKELNRGGQIFIIHNKVNDMEQYAHHIKELVPAAKIVVAHGQMSEKQLESKIKSFFLGAFDILISTTIIENGIDIPNANTMIIDRADNFGLSQLHQLRGRIGRSDKKAYAYFSIPKHRNLTEVAAKRLQALKKYADIGSGFSIASSDLELRGAGDILGGEQSGHIENIGLELYMELLKEAIQELKGEKVSNHSEIEIITPFASLIPKRFIQDSGQRLRYYKRLSNASELEGLEDVFAEINDVYGILPEQLINLNQVLQSRVILKDTGIKKVKLSGTRVTLFFDTEIVKSNTALRNKMLDLFLASKKKYKVNPDYSVVCTFKEGISLSSLIDFSYTLKKELVAS
jgi:transcription-repair coupling factor (superfamily II helicase)